MNFDDQISSLPKPQNFFAKLIDTSNAPFEHKVAGDCEELRGFVAEKVSMVPMSRLPISAP